MAKLRVPLISLCFAKRTRRHAPALYTVAYPPRPIPTLNEQAPHPLYHIISCLCRRCATLTWTAPRTMAHNTLTQEDEAYLAQHPAVRDLVRCIVCECLRKRPEDPVDHIRKFVAQRDLARSVSLTRAYVTPRSWALRHQLNAHRRVPGCLPHQSKGLLRQGPHPRRSCTP